MNAFLYYFVHTFVNTLKKMFKSWVVLFIVGCMAFGMIVGFTVAMLTDHDDPEPDDEIVEVVPPEEIPEDIFDNPVIEVAEDGSFFTQVFDVSEVKGPAAFEAGAAAIILLLFSISVLTADKTAETLFLPADANLLFSAPVKPQSVLLFRLLLQLGASVFSGLYLMFQLPRLMEIFEVGVSGMVITMVSLVLSMFWTKLIEVIMYMFTAGNARRKNLTRYCLYGILGALLLGSIAYLSAVGKLNLGGLITVFASPLLRFIPVWGWIKAACGYAVTGNTMIAWACILLTFAATVVSIILIWRARADFYEDAINKAEARAELLTQAAETGMMQRKKERKSSLMRDGFDYGHGASTFFFKAMYNRFRFAHFHFFTKTAETYTAIALLFTILFRFVLTDIWQTQTGEEGGMHIIALLGFGLLMMVFYRSLASTLPEDAKNDLFRMAPQRTWLKLFYSAMADQLNCFLDILPGILIAGIALKAPLSYMVVMLVGIPVMNFYAGCVSAFMTVAGGSGSVNPILAMIRIMFIIYGFVPLALLMAVFWAWKGIYVSVLLTALCGVAIGTLFLIGTGRMLDPGFRARVEITGMDREGRRQAREDFSRIGFSLIIILLLSAVFQIVMAVNAGEALAKHTWLMLMVNFVPLYVSIPFAVLFLKRVKPFRYEKQKLTVRQIVLLMIVCLGLTYLFNYVGAAVNAFIASFAPDSAEGLNPLQDLAGDISIWLRLFYMVIMAPLTEEFLFRRQFIDRSRIYGEWNAVIMSAILFGLFHGNFAQFFYALVLGLVFGYVYVKTNDLRYTIFLHFFINLMGGIIIPAVPEETAAIMAMVFAVIGIVSLIMIIRNRKKFTLPETIAQIKGRDRLTLIYGNPGMISCIFCCCLLFASVVFMAMIGAA